MSCYCSAKVCPGRPEELLEDYPLNAQEEVGIQNLVNDMSDYVMQVSADSLFKCLFCEHPFRSLSSKSKHMKVHNHYSNSWLFIILYRLARAVRTPSSSVSSVPNLFLPRRGKSHTWTPVPQAICTFRIECSATFQLCCLICKEIYSKIYICKWCVCVSSKHKG